MEKMIVLTKEQMNAKGVLLSESETRTKCKVTPLATSKKNSTFTKYGFEGQRALWIDDVEVIDAASRAGVVEVDDNGAMKFNASSFTGAVEGGALVIYAE
jgi:hypothetical protein